MPDEKEPVTYRLRDARLLAGLFCDYLAGGPDALDGQRTALCRWSIALDQWEPWLGKTDALVAGFIAWCLEEG